MKYEIVTRAADLRRYAACIVPAYSDVKQKDLSFGPALAEALDLDIDRIKKEESFSGGESEELFLRVATRGGTRRIVLMGFGKQRSTGTGLIRRRMLRAGQIVRGRGYRDVAIVFPDYPPSGMADGMEAALVGVHLGVSRPPRFKKQVDGKTAAPAKLAVYYPTGRDRTIGKVLENVSSLVPAITAARDLVDEPPNLIGPQELARRAGDLASGKGVTVKVHELEKGAGSGFPLVWWVGRGSARRPLVVEMTYAPKTKTAVKHAVLVGKGVVFDSGGLDLKGFHNMGNMKNDMAGAAVVAAVTAAAAEMRLPLAVTAILPIAENVPSGEAYRPGDILTSRSGKTVEVTSTDAEGRLMLADALTYAAEKKPDVIVDIATLTGACLVALGPFAAGLFSNDDLLAKMIEEAAAGAGELLWRLPLFEELMPQVRSDIADLRNTLIDPYGGAIGGGLFLREFIGKLPWAHIDIAGPAYFEKRSELGPRGATGYGVSTLLRLLRRLSEDRKG